MRRAYKPPTPPASTFPLPLARAGTATSECVRRGRGALILAGRLLMNAATCRARIGLNSEYENPKPLNYMVGSRLGVRSVLHSVISSSSNVIRKRSHTCHSAKTKLKQQLPVV